jgi:hypothetical protein
MSVVWEAMKIFAERDVSLQAVKLAVETGLRVCTETACLRESALWGELKLQFSYIFTPVRGQSGAVSSAEVEWSDSAVQNSGDQMEEQGLDQNAEITESDFADDSSSKEIEFVEGRRRSKRLRKE